MSTQEVAAHHGNIITGSSRVHVLPVESDPNKNLTESAIKWWSQSLTTNSERAYRRQGENFVYWCMNNNREPMVCTPETLGSYVAFMADVGYAPATIEQAIAVIRWAHDAQKHYNEPNTSIARDILRVYRRKLADEGYREKQSPPILVPSLTSMSESCEGNDITGIRNRAMILLGFGMMARRSELVGLNIQDLRLLSNGDASVFLRKSKTDKQSRGVEVIVPPGKDEFTDSTRALEEWLDVLDSAGIEGGRLFREITWYGKIKNTLSAQSVNLVVKQLAQEVELSNAEDYSAHGLRAGGATSSYMAGIPIKEICRHGRWNPNSGVVMRYIRAVDNARSDVMKGMWNSVDSRS